MKSEFFLEKQQEIEMNLIKLQRSLDEKKRNYDEVVSSIPGGVCKILCDRDLTVLYANEFYYKMLGYSPEEIKKNSLKNLRMVTHEADFDMVKSSLLKSFEDHSHKVEIEFRQLGRAGKTVWILAGCVYNEALTGGFTCVFINITDRKKVEEELRVSEEEYRIAIQQHTEKIIVRYDLFKKTITRPKWASELLGVPQVMENVPYSMIERGYILPEGAADYIEFYESIDKGVPQGKCVFKLNNQRWYRADYTLVYNELKKPIRAVVSYEDVTEQRERAFAYEKWRQYNSSLKEKNIAYYEYNLTKDTVECLDASLSSKLPKEVSKSFSALVRYVSDHFIFAGDREKYRRFFSRELLLSRYYMGKKELGFEYRRLNADGEPYWVSTTCQLLPDPYSEDIKLLVLMCDIDAQKQEEDKLQKLSQTDSLTGLLNRRTIAEKIDALLKKLGDGCEYAFIMIDIDHFKELNDTLGHLFGDQVLIDIGRILQSSLTEGELIGRLGGDEFAVFLRRGVSGLHLSARLDKMLRSLLKSFDQGIVISGSIGVALAPNDGVTFVSLYQKADIALYQAKNYGRNQIVFYKEHMDTEKFVLSEMNAKELLQRESMQWSNLEKRIFAYYNIVFSSLYEELYEFNLTANEYLMIYHVPAKYKIPPEKGKLVDLINDMAAKVVYLEDRKKFMGFLSLAALRQLSLGDTVACEAEFRKCREDGEYRWVSIELIPFTAENGDRIVLACSKDISAKKEAEEKARRNYKDRDQLTGYASFERFRTECGRLLGNRGSKKYSLWYCDLKNFKFINDIYGYEFGDRVLRYWAQVIEQGMGEGEAFARKSADHFMMLRQYEHVEELERRFNRSVNLLRNYEEFAAKKFQLDMVAGIYLIEKDEDVLLMEDMIDRANLAQRQAKGEGGSRFALYREEMRHKVIYEKEMEAEMYRALGRREFCVYLQPQVAIAREAKIVGAEALVRWVRSDGCVVPPGDFIPLFEKNGFIVKLDRFVFEEVCRDLSERMKQGRPLFMIAVNVSRISAFQSDFAETYIKLKRRYEIPEGLLEIEFTETVIVENVQHLSNVMQVMRAEGFLFSLDDFGSGYSSLNMLKNIVVDVIKLDMMFFKNSVDIKREQIIVASVVYMAKALEMRIVSEGVETKEQLKRLQDLGCDIVQGHYFGQAVPKDEFDYVYAELL